MEKQLLQAECWWIFYLNVVILFSMMYWICLDQVIMFDMSILRLYIFICSPHRVVDFGARPLEKPLTLLVDSHLAH